MVDPVELPDELREGGAAAPATAEDAAAQYKRLDSLGKLVADKRDAAVKARKDSGIEDVWTACEEAYAGIDDMNRSETAGAGQPWRKPTSPTGPLTKDSQRAAEARSTIFIKLTTRYVDMARAKVKEKAIPIGGMPFSMEPTPEPHPVQASTDDAQQPPAPMAAPPAVQGQPAPNPATAQPAQLTPAAQAAQAAIDKARESAKKAATRIWDWLEEARYTKQIGRVIDDAARIGVGVLKGPFPQGATDRSLSADGEEIELEIVQRTYPGVSWIDAWNFFPAPNCGEDIHDGDHAFERNYLSEGRLRALKDLREPGGLPIYLPEAIDKVIEEGPEKCNRDDAGNRKDVPQDKKGMFVLWHYTGEMTRKDMIALQALGAEELPDDVIYCDAVVTLVNDTVIRAQFNPLEKTGNLPYRVMSWSRRAGYWAGVGVAEQVAVPQKMVNAGTRAWMNNAGVSSGVQLVVDTKKLQPVDNSLVIGGGVKLWETTVDGMGIDVRTLLAAIEIPNKGQELKAIVDYAFQLAEELSNIPLVTQGRDGPTTPQTFGQAELQNTNANTLLRDIADRIDSELIEPLIDDYNEWLLLDTDVPEDEKGNFRVIAKGCQAMVEKAIQEQTLMMMLQLSLNPVFGMDPAKWMESIVRSKRLDPDDLKYDAARLSQIQGTPPPDAPVVAAAKVRAATDLHLQDMRNKGALDEIAAQIQSEQQALVSGGATPHGARAMAMVETAHIRAVSAENIESSRADAEQARAQKELEIARENGWFDLKKMEMQRDILILEYARREQLTLMQVKAQLAGQAMQEQTKRELAQTGAMLGAHDSAADRAHEATQNALDRSHEMQTREVAPPAPQLAEPPAETGNT